MEVQTLVVSESDFNGLTNGRTITLTASDGTTIPVLNSDGTFNISDGSELSSPSFELTTMTKGAPTERADDPLPIGTAIALNVAEMLANNGTEVLKSAHEVHLVTEANHSHRTARNNVLTSAYRMACSEEYDGENCTEEDRGYVPQSLQEPDGPVGRFEMPATSSEILRQTPAMTTETDCCGANDTAQFLLPDFDGQTDGTGVANSTRNALRDDLESPLDDADGNTNTVVIDVSNPIQLCQNSLIMVNGQKCVLQQNVETGQLIAYPVKEPVKPTKRRGRPRKKRTYPTETSKSIVDKSADGGQQHDVAVFEEEEPLEKGLVVMENEAGEIVKRSARKRKTNSHFSEYEVGKIKIEGSEEEESVGENAIEDDDRVPKKRGKHARKGGNRLNSSESNVTNHQAKRGRGRPRRYNLEPPPTQAFLIQTVDGETIVMQVPMSSIPPGVSVQNVAQSIAESLDGANNQEQETQYLLPLAPSNEESPPVISIADEGTTDASSETAALLSDTGMIDEHPENVLPPQSRVECIKQLDGNGMKLSVQATSTATIAECPIKQRLLSSTANTVNDAVTKAVAAITDPETVSIESMFDGSSLVEEAPTVNPTTVIPLPPDVISLLLPNKEEPIKIGLRASEEELEKLLCPKCGFQAFYTKQYQEHLTVHESEAQKCKCCVFLALREEDLVRHYKDSHPKCICEICNHTAEHPYLIKRHMCRHGEAGSTCDTCGKTYKDQYILRMHIRTVHTPAEVLFECAVCSKKFSRKAHLKRHLRTHDPDKKYKCLLCDYRGCERSDITKHQLIHEAPKHICEVCGQAFRHVKNKELHVKRHRGQKDYKCGVCDFFGYTFTDIRKHIERRHTDSKTIICDMCGQVFETEQSLTEHQASDQCDDFRLEEALQEPDSLNEMSSSQLAVQTIRDKQLSDETNVTDANEITSITLTDESIATLNALGGLTSPIMVSEEMREQLSASRILKSADGQVAILDAFLDHDANNQVAVVTADGQIIQGVVMDAHEPHRSWKMTATNEIPET